MSILNKLADGTEIPDSDEEITQDKTPINFEEESSFDYESET